MLKTITHPVTGQSFKMGRKRPTLTAKLTFKQIADAGVLPNVTVPQTTNYSGIAAKSLHDIYKNDVWGCCVVAGAFHVRGVTSFNSTKGYGVVFSDAQVEHDYAAIGGFDPSKTQPDGSNPTDNGCDEITALNYWRTHGFPDGVKLLNYAAVDPTNVAEIKLAMYLFENLYFGVELPDAWVNPFPQNPGFVWDVAGDPVPENGHCFIGCDLHKKGIKIDTWGMTGEITFDAIAKYASDRNGGQLFTLLTPDIVNRLTQKSPAGYDITTLTKYLAKV